MEITLTSIIGIIQLLGTIIVFSVIKFNDLSHLHADVKTLVSRQEGISNKVSLLAEDLSYVKGTVDALTSKKSFKKSKKISNKV